MTDITERLRKEGVFEDVFSGELKTDPLCLDAIAEIEALRQRVKELEAEYEEYMKEKVEQIDSLQTELAALKAGQGEWEDAVLGQHSITYTSAPSIPEGWRLVPVEPTPEMIAARVGFYDGGRTNAEYSCIAGYKAMLSAVPNGITAFNPNNAASNVQSGARQSEPVAWRTFDGEGGYSFRAYEDNETYRDDYIARNGERYRDWVQPLFTSAPSIPEGWQLVPVEAIEQINKWAEAYPLDAFPEPDWKDVADKLGRNGLLDCVSASNMRHVITKVQSMLSAAPKPGEPK